MGIKGLLPLLGSISKPSNLSKFSGETLGVDAYVWLHRGTTACPIELCRGKPTSKFVESAMHRVRMLQHFGITPYLVFDGDFLPSKAATEDERAKKREQSRRVAEELMNAGKVSKAYQEFQKAVNVTPEMARQLIDELKRCGIKFVVAPYEADAQLAYLEKIGVISGVISEDSDLLVFGVQRLLTKLDQYGECIEINRKDFTACKAINLTGWSNEEFRTMAILSGCDYLASLQGIGLMKAYRLVRKHKNIEAVIKSIQFEGKIKISTDYLDSFKRAEQTFLYQRVFCPKANKLVPFSEPGSGLDLSSLLFVGHDVPPTIAASVASGDLHPSTKEPLFPRSTTASSRHGRRGNFNKSKGQPAEDLKGNKSINNFFKPTRVPLAELDPNSFIPSPHQRAVLVENAGNSWASSPVPAPPSRRTSNSAPVSSANAPLSAPQIGRSNAGKANAGSRPIKRPRLCETVTNLDFLDMDDSIESTSRYFAPKKPKTSVHVDKSRPKAKGQNTEITIFSDDSIGEYLANLSPEHKNSATSPSGLVNDATDKNKEMAVASPPADVGSNSASVLESISAKYSYNPDRKKSTSSAERSAGSTPSQSKSKGMLGTKKGVSRKELSKPAAAPRPLTPLQRMGVAAMARIRPGEESVPENANGGIANTVDDLIPLDFSAISATAGSMETPAPKGGSEDLLVSTSEDDDEIHVQAETERCQGGNTTLDLGKYLFKTR